MPTLLQLQAVAVIAAEFLFGAGCVVGLFRAGKLTLARVRE